MLYKLFYYIDWVSTVNALEEIKIVIPEHIKNAIRLPPDEVERRLRIELALRLYEKSIVSLGVARRIAGLTKWEFLELLAREKIPIHYGEEELREDLEWIEK